MMKQRICNEKLMAQMKDMKTLIIFLE